MVRTAITSAVVGGLGSMAGAVFGALMGWVIQAFEVPALVAEMAVATLKGLQGDINLDASGDATRTAYMSEIQNQKFQPLPWPKKP